jgi:hypothetical protein
MKQKFAVIVNSHTSLNDNILAAIGNYNSGKSDFSLSDIIGWVKLEKAIFTNLRSKTVYESAKNTSGDIVRLSLSDDGGDTWCLEIELVAL